MRNRIGYNSFMIDMIVHPPWSPYTYLLYGGRAERFRLDRLTALQRLWRAAGVGFSRVKKLVGQCRVARYATTTGVGARRTFSSASVFSRRLLTWQYLRLIIAGHARAGVRFYQACDSILYHAVQTASRGSERRRPSYGFGGDGGGSREASSRAAWARWRQHIFAWMTCTVHRQLESCEPFARSSLAGMQFQL